MAFQKTVDVLEVTFFVPVEVRDVECFPSEMLYSIMFSYGRMFFIFIWRIFIELESVAIVKQ